MTLWGAVEGGGTKFLCAVGSAHDRVVESTRIPTTSPDETLGRIIDFFRPRAVEALGVATFGPLELREGTPDYGSTLETPKPGWSSVPVRARLADALGIPVVIDTDVNAAALAEARWGVARGCDVVLYITVGTGVGGGVLVRGVPLHGLMHPELGHIPVPRLADAQGRPDDFGGVCPFHGRCLEGLVSGPALSARVGRPAEQIPEDHPVWELTARYIGVGVASAVLTLSPERVVLGGGVMSRAPLLPWVRTQTRRTLAGYVARPELGDKGIDRYVVAASFPESKGGLYGAFALAMSR